LVALPAWDNVLFGAGRACFGRSTLRPCKEMCAIAIRRCCARDPKKLRPQARRPKGTVSVVAGRDGPQTRRTETVPVAQLGLTRFHTGLLGREPFSGGPSGRGSWTTADPGFRFASPWAKFRRRFAASNRKGRFGVQRFRGFHSDRLDRNASLGQPAACRALTAIGSFFLRLLLAGIRRKNGYLTLGCLAQ